MAKVLKQVKKISGEIDPVFSTSLADTINDDRGISVRDIMEGLRLGYKPNAKINLGLSRYLEASS